MARGANSKPVALPILKIQQKDGNWMWITDVTKVVDRGYKRGLRCLEVGTIDDTIVYELDVLKIYLCNGTTGSTIDCLL